MFLDQPYFVNLGSREGRQRLRVLDPARRVYDDVNLVFIPYKGQSIFFSKGSPRSHWTNRRTGIERPHFVIQ